jgi:anti-sigma B factor antagonist
MSGPDRSPRCVHLEGELTVYRAVELRMTLQAALAEAGDLELDLARVTELDSAGVQLLLSAKKTAVASQRRLRLMNHSPAVLDVFERFNLAGHFGDPLVITG